MEDSLDNNKSTRQWNVFTIKYFKWCFVNASIDSGIDSHFSDRHIVKPVLLVFIQQMCMKDLTNGAIMHSV